MAYDTAAIAAQLQQSTPLVPFDRRTLEFTHDLSRSLAFHPVLRSEGAIQALAFWLRPAETRRLEAHFRAMEGDAAVLVPRGTVFHIPPSNVDTIFVYSWLLSLLAGNRNVIRLSQRLSGTGALLADVVRDVLTKPGHEDIASGSIFLRYGHDNALTEELSELADLRVIWGGDEAVRSLRALPLRPSATELVFPDRYGATALAAEAVAALSGSGRDELAERFVNDAFWFDQMACASPRLLLWLGDDEKLTNEVAPDFWKRVAQAANRRGAYSEAGTVLSKITETAKAAIDEHATAVWRISPEVTVVRLVDLAALKRVTVGGGLFHEALLPSLIDFAPYLNKRDQTLGVFGLPRDQIIAAARAFNGRGVDRFVPVGQALAFSHVWDGYELFEQFTRRVSVVRQGW